MSEEKKVILIVEDETSLLNVLFDEFTKKGFEVLKARNGAEGLGVALEKHPDMILLDIIMPVMDGMTMLGELRKDEWGKSAEVIILTNLSDSQSTLDAIERNTYDFLVKSDWKIEDILAKVRSRLGM